MARVPSEGKEAKQVADRDEQAAAAATAPTIDVRTADRVEVDAQTEIATVYDAEGVALVRLSGDIDALAAFAELLDHHVATAPDD